MGASGPPLCLSVIIRGEDGAMKTLCLIVVLIAFAFGSEIILGWSYGDMSVDQMARWLILPLSLAVFAIVIRRRVTAPLSPEGAS